VLASARDLAGAELLSCEAAAYANGAYSTTWNKVLQTMGSVFAGGVNQAVLHGFAYRDAPGAAWPGFAAFSPYGGTGIGYAEAWGPRQPTWRHVADVAGWFVRTQQVLRTGTARTDLAAADHQPGGLRRRRPAGVRPAGSRPAAVVPMN
jgi:hypothetical protein